MPKILIKNLSFSRGSRKIFNDITFSIEENKITAIMGPSGTGKTTLLRLIGGQLKPDAGTVFFNDQNIHHLSSHALYHLRRSMGMLFQSGALFTGLSVYENVAFPLREHTDLSEGLIRDWVFIKLQAVGLRGACDLMPAQLSGGMARRVALARAIVFDPELIMYDEPFAGQDPMTLGVIMKLIKTLNDTLGMTSILVSHDVKEVFDLADYIYIIADGHIIGQGTPETLTQMSSPQLKQFIEGLPDGPVPFHYPVKSWQEEIEENLY